MSSPRLRALSVARASSSRCEAPVRFSLIPPPGGSPAAMLGGEPDGSARTCSTLSASFVGTSP